MDVHAIYALLLRPFRRRRMRAFARALRPGADTAILDVGGTPFNWRLAPTPARVVLLNRTLPADAASLPPNVSCAVGDATRLDYADASFEIAFSNSVIEHLGSWEAQQAFARELRRVGRRLWVQTPARCFPFEPHLLTPFVHWLPRGWQRPLLRHFTLWGLLSRPRPEAVERFWRETRLLGLREMRELFPDCEIRRERFLGWTKAYVAVRGAEPLR
jgi:hypothetical protein